MQRRPDQGQNQAPCRPATHQALRSRPWGLFAESSSRLPTSGELRVLYKHAIVPATLCCWKTANKLSRDLQLENAAKEFVRRFAKQEQDEDYQPPADLQVFLHSSAHFGPAGMRELLVRQTVSIAATAESMLLSLQAYWCAVFFTVKPCVSARHDSRDCNISCYPQGQFIR